MPQQNYNNDYNNNQNQGNSNNAPVFENSNLGVAAWVEEDKNGNAYLSVKLPLVDNVNIFPRDDQVADAMNSFARNL